jgi:hypothetical protein
MMTPVVGTLSERGYEPLGEWQFTEDQAEFVALAMRYKGNRILSTSMTLKTVTQGCQRSRPSFLRLAGELSRQAGLDQLVETSGSVFLTGER